MEEFTYIYKTAYDARISPDSYQDTLTLIISAIGVNFDDTFGPAKDRLNIVNEDMNDYIYLCIMAKVLRIGTKQYAILPSFGISNFINVCSIYMVRGVVTWRHLTTMLQVLKMEMNN